MKYMFTINEKAIGKQRPRMNTYTHRTYTPKKTIEFEEKVKWAFILANNVDLKYVTKPIKAKITVFYKPAKSLSNKKKKELIEQKYYTSKPDTDNIAKAILDSLNGVAYKDDSQVVELLVTKYYGEEDKIEVELEIID